MGDAAALDGAKAMALTTAEFLLDRTLQVEVRRAFEISQGLSAVGGPTRPGQGQRSGA